MSDFAWTDRRVDELKALWTEGLSANEIASEMGDGLTRNAVLGKAHRLGLEARAKVVPTRPRMRHRKGGLQFNRMKQLAAPPIAPKPAPAPAAAPPGTRRCGLLELRNESCRWPIGDAAPFTFCGTPEADLRNGVPYCRACSRLAYRRPGEREEAA